MTWLPAFLWTLAIEVPLALMILRVPGVSLGRIAMIVALATAVSHPFLSFVVLPFTPAPFVVSVLIGETIVIAIEASIFRRGLGMQRAHALAASATLNAASYLFGLAFLNA